MTFSALDSGLTGPLLATEPMRAVFSDRARVAAMLQAEAALARAQSRFGLAPAALAEALAGLGPEALDVEALGNATALAGVPTIPFVKAVQRLLPDGLEPFFHAGATTQDILDTALVLQMRQGLDLLAVDLAATLDGLSRLAESHRETPCIGRSYGQQAQPLSFGFKVAVWAVGLAEVAERLPDLRRRVLRASLGGPVGTLAALGEHGPPVARAFADELGLGAAPIAWHVRRAAIVEVGTWLATAAGALAKVATDVVGMASTEVAELAEPHLPGRGGSSAMPHKRNPVSATVILAAHAASGGHVATLIAAMAVPGERSPGLWHAEWHALPALFGLASGALAEGRRLAEGLVVDPARMGANLEATRGLLFADGVAARLAGRLGKRAAHELLEAAADRVRSSGRDLRDVLADDPRCGLSPAEVADAFDPAPSVAAAARWVSPALAAVARARAALS